VTDGSVSARDGSLELSGATEATVLFSAGTSMADPRFGEHTLQRVRSAAEKGYGALLKEHIADYQRFYRRVSLELPEGPSAGLPTIERLRAAAKGEDDPSLATLFFNFGRYLMISSSRPDSPLPANRKGVGVVPVLDRSSPYGQEANVSRLVLA